MVRNAPYPSALAPQRGMTTIELLVVIALIGLLTALSVASYRYVIDRNRVASEVNGLLGDMQLARAEAIKQGLTVKACVSTNGATCTGQTTWQSGWIVIDSSSNVLRVQPPFTNSDTFVANNNLSSVSFNREGFALGLVAGTQVTLKNSAGLQSATRCLQLTTVGLMSVATYGGSCT